LPDNDRNRRPGEKLEHASYEGLGDKWVSACELKKGDRVLLANADTLTGKPKYGIVIDVETEDCEEYTTYNFEVADFHTYYVGENGVCVHNADCNIKTGDAKDFSIHESKRVAFRAAKSDAGVSGMQPDSVGPAVTRQGHVMQQGATYNFGDKQILLHSGGHPEYGMTRHFNYNGWHYFY